MTYPSYSPGFHSLIWYLVTRLIMNAVYPTFYFLSLYLSLRSKYSPQHCVSNTLLKIRFNQLKESPCFMELSIPLPYSEQPMARMQSELHAENKLQSIPILSSHRHLGLPCISKLSRTSTQIVYKLCIRRRRHGTHISCGLHPYFSETFRSTQLINRVGICGTTSVARALHCLDLQ
jgi:hypothetical protein